ncbi:heparan-alpha-glucosaminide N-acetyltransferase domain-containing protein [Microbacterium sp.]|uniref:heparan-alpha-glucosaminide N-acetyltransferase domain-containing protein n=1 Tax=Microbacterium sp. TaxID=51671 RepID=UPI0025D9252C|nr:heparan-alpha-glucosaminide N-acetyltransferase domain-containing protein [Microbacterium sp.]
MSERSEKYRLWLSTRWSRLNGPQRVGGVDLARGLAVIGMVAAHLLWIDDFDFADTATWVAVVEGRSSILFATLAGVSIGLVTGGRTPLAGAEMRLAREHLAVRAAVLWLIGIGLIATGVPVYVILPAYAILFLIALLLVSLRARTLFLLAGALALVTPLLQALLDALPFWSTPWGQLASVATGWHYPFPVWIAFVTAGLGVARAGITRTRVQLWMVGAGAALALAGYGLDGLSGADAASGAVSFSSAVWTADPHSTGLLEVIGSGGFALAVIGLCLLACRTFLTWVVLPLRAVGAMPLTAYTVQLLVWAIVAATVLGDPGDLRGFRDLEPFWPMTMTLILACTAWALLIGRGPLEWVVDRIARPTVRRR